MYLKRIAVAFGIWALLIAGYALFTFKGGYLTPFARKSIEAPLYTVGDENYGRYLEEGKKVLKIGPLPLGLYGGGMAFERAEEAMAYLRKKGKLKKGWGVYLLSGDFRLDTRKTDGGARTVKTLILLDRIEP